MEGIIVLNNKMLKTVLCLNLIQFCVYLFGFVNRVATQTGRNALVDVTRIWYNFGGIVFWSILSMISVIGFTLTLYLLISKAFPAKQNIGLIISVIGYASPIIFSFFLIIPMTLLILGTIFGKVLILDSAKYENTDEKTTVE